MSGDVLGIDLGTTNSAVATVDASGRVVMVRNAVGAELTPSVVYFEDDGTALVGEEARLAAASDPANGVELIKRQIGNEFAIELRGQIHTPESISALILKYVSGTDSAGSTGAFRGSAKRAVITVPAYFGLAEKEATHQAGEIAGLDVLELLAEPVAAAASYGLTAVRTATALIFDLGGGTFDTTVLRLGDGAVNVLATDGHHKLGGADVNRRLVTLALERIERQLDPDLFAELSDDEAFLGAVNLEVEALKRGLGSRAARDLVVRAPSGPVTVRITALDLQLACSDLLDSTETIVERVVAASRERGAGKIDEVVMVGGSSRLSGVAERLERLIGVVPRLVEPDLAVAKGAAIWAHQLSATPQAGALAAATRHRGQTPMTALVPVLPRSIGLLIEDSHDPSGRSFVEHIVKANTPLPVSATTCGFGSIIDGQETVRIQVYEQAGAIASDAVQDNQRVLDGELLGLPHLPAGSVIEITFTVETDGRLRVVAFEPRSRRQLTLEAFMEGVADSAETKRLSTLVAGITVRG